MTLEEAKTLSVASKVKVNQMLPGKAMLLCADNVTEVVAIQEDCYDEDDDLCVFVRCLGDKQTWYPYEYLDIVKC